MSTDTTATAAGASRRDAVVEQLFLGAIGALETLHVYIGDRLGLYVALAGMPDATPNELANTAGIAERYAREWLEQQAVSGLLDVVHDEGDPSTRRYRLPTEVVKIMTDAQASATSRLSSRPGPRRREQRAARRSDISESVIHQPMSGR